MCYCIQIANILSGIASIRQASGNPEAQRLLFSDTQVHTVGMAEARLRENKLKVMQGHTQTLWGNIATENQLFRSY